MADAGDDGVGGVRDVFGGGVLGAAAVGAVAGGEVLVGSGLGVGELVGEADVVVADAGDDGVAHTGGCE